MLSRIFQLLLVACLVMSSVWAANDPFVGKWKVNPSKSKLNDEMKVEVAGANGRRLARRVTSNQRCVCLLRESAAFAM
jgi:hypothetical protein